MKGIDKEEAFLEEMTRWGTLMGERSYEKALEVCKTLESSPDLPSQSLGIKFELYIRLAISMHFLLDEMARDIYLGQLRNLGQTKSQKKVAGKLADTWAERFANHAPNSLTDFHPEEENRPFPP